MEYFKFRNFLEGFIFAKLGGNETLSKMEESLRHLLMKVNHAPVAHF